MNTLIIEDGGFGYEWWRANAPSGWEVISTHGNRKLVATIVNTYSLRKGVVVALIDYVADSEFLYKLRRAVSNCCSTEVRIIYYPCFEWALLTSTEGQHMFLDDTVLVAYMTNYMSFRNSSVLTEIMDKVYGTGNTKSSEKLAKQLLAHNVADCAKVNSKHVGTYWTTDCDCTGFSRPCFPSSLAVKNSSILERIGIDFTFTTETSGLVTRSMIDNYGSYELALQHLKEIGVI